MRRKNICLEEETLINQEAEEEGTKAPEEPVIVKLELPAEPTPPAPAPKRTGRKARAKYIPYA